MAMLVTVFHASLPWRGASAIDLCRPDLIRSRDALHRVYRTGDDRFLQRAAGAVDLPRLESILALNEFGARSEEARVSRLPDAFSAVPLEVWRDRLRKGDVGAAPCDTMETIRSAATRSAGDLPGTAEGSYAFSLHADHPMAML